MLCSVKLFMKHDLKHRVLYINICFFNHVTGFNDLNIEHS